MDLRLKGYLLVTRIKKKQEERERNDALDNKVEYAFCYREAAHFKNLSRSCQKVRAVRIIEASWFALSFKSVEPVFYSQFSLVPSFP